MTFLVTFIVLLIERFFDWSHLRHWRWYENYQRLIIKPIHHQSSFLILAAIVVPLVLFTALMQLCLKGVLFGFLSLIFEILLVLYCLGPQNLWADTFACISALTEGELPPATQELGGTFGGSKKKTSHEKLIGKIFIASNSRVFAVLFWFIALGPAGAVLYRSVSLAISRSPYQQTHAEVVPGAKIVLDVLDWLPVRIFTFLFALGGHFGQVLSLWRKNVLTSVNYNDALLVECGTAALGQEEITQPKEGVAEKHAISLLDRVFVIALVIVAISALF